MPLSFRQARLPQGLWRSEARPDLVIDAAVAIMLNSRGIAYLSPELVLLAKSRQGRKQDRADFVEAVARLDAGSRARLAGFMPKGHAWRSITAWTDC